MEDEGGCCLRPGNTVRAKTPVTNNTTSARVVRAIFLLDQPCLSSKSFKPLISSSSMLDANKAFLSSGSKSLGVTALFADRIDDEAISADGEKGIIGNVVSTHSCDVSCDHSQVYVIMLSTAIFTKCLLVRYTLEELLESSSQNIW